MRERKRNEFSLNVGTSSILFIFVILCLISFAVLALASAMSDKRLSERVADNTTAYYEACNEAERMLADTDTALKAVYDTGISRTGYYEKTGKKMTFSVPVTDMQTLNVEIKILYPENEGDTFYEIEKWQVETTGEFEIDDSLPVFK